MDTSAWIVSLLSTYQLPAIFIGSFFFGETVIITAAFLSAQGIWAPGNVFWLSLAGTMASDSLWFLFGHYVFTLLGKWEAYKDKYAKFALRLEKISGRRPFLALLFIKFLYGTRILTIIYLSLRKISFGTFTLFNAIGTVIWLSVIIPIGWLTGKGIADFVPIFNKLEYGLIFLVLVVAAFKAITLWAGKKIESE